MTSGWRKTSPPSGSTSPAAIFVQLTETAPGCLGQATRTYRAKHLEAFKKTETDERFKQLASSVQWSWDEVKAKKDLEKREEAARHGKSYEPSASSSAPRDEGKDDHK